MERISFVTHRGQRVLLLDYTGCNTAEVADISDKVPTVVTQEPAGSVLLLADFLGAEFSRAAVEHLKIAVALDKPHIKRAAWVLDDNLPKALYDSIRSFSTRELPVFASREEAMEYLVS